MFDGQEANSSTISLTITENGSPIVTEIETVYYLENPYQPLGLTLSYNGGQFDFLYNSSDPLPSTLTVGGSGPLGSGTYFVANTNDAIGSLTETYAVALSPLGRQFYTVEHIRDWHGQRAVDQRNDRLRDQRRRGDGRGVR